MPCFLFWWYKGAKMLVHEISYGVIAGAKNLESGCSGANLQKTSPTCIFSERCRKISPKSKLLKLLSLQTSSFSGYVASGGCFQTIFLWNTTYNCLLYIVCEGMMFFFEAVVLGEVWDSLFSVFFGPTNHIDWFCWLDHGMRASGGYGGVFNPSHSPKLIINVACPPNKKFLGRQDNDFAHPDFLVHLETSFFQQWSLNYTYSWGIKQCKAW